jgi:hypothetical protein
LGIATPSFVGLAMTSRVMEFVRRGKTNLKKLAVIAPKRGRGAKELYGHCKNFAIFAVKEFFI